MLEQQENKKVLEHSKVALEAAEVYHSELVQMEKDQKEKAEINDLLSPSLQLAQTSTSSEKSNGNEADKEQEVSLAQVGLENGQAI